MTDLGDLPGGGDQSMAEGINDVGQVVGFSGAETSTHGFLWDSVNGIIDLGDLHGGSDFSQAFGINNLGQVVGSSRAANGERAFLWNSDDGMQDLNDLLYDPIGWSLRSAFDINASGQIAGYGDHDGFLRGFLLTPVAGGPPPPGDGPPPVPGDGSSASTPLFPEEPPPPEEGAPPPEEGAPVVFEFPPFEVEEEQTVFIDPPISVGYDYIVIDGPNIASALLPAVAGDDGQYQIYLWDGDGFDIFLDDAFAGVAFFFDGLGVDQFRVLGIDQAAMLDPENPVAFVTGLTFVSAGTVDMRMAAVTDDTHAHPVPGPAGVPEPGAITLLGAGLLGLCWSRRPPSLRSGATLARPRESRWRLLG